MPDGRIQQRIDPQLQKEAERILKIQGIKPSQAITIFYMEIKRSKGLPFRPSPVSRAEIPNARLQKAMRESDRGEGIRTFSSKKALFASLRRL